MVSVCGLSYFLFWEGRKVQLEKGCVEVGLLL